MSKKQFLIYWLMAFLFSVLESMILNDRFLVSLFTSIISSFLAVLTVKYILLIITKSKKI